MFDTIEKIIDDVISKMTEEDKVWVSNASLRDVRGLHHFTGMHIRNHYGLWHDNPLTERWRTQPETHDVRGGVDYSEDHPDNLSGKILTGIWEKLQGYGQKSSAIEPPAL